MAGNDESKTEGDANTAPSSGTLAESSIEESGAERDVFSKEAKDKSDAEQNGNQKKGVRE